MNTRLDILVLEENTAGKDYIMADLHGNADCLDAMLKQLQPEDRLFIAGDLTDRGADSPRVIRLILDYQAKHPNKLYIVYGNHEDLNVLAISALADYFEAVASIPYSADDNSALIDYANSIMANPLGSFHEQMNDIHFCLANGGFWLVELFRSEILLNRLYISETNSLKQSDDSLIAQYYQLVSELPYMIYVKGKRPFTIVHADRPMSHQAMLEKLATNNLTLDEDQKQHAMNARTRRCDAHGRVINTDQILVNIEYDDPSATITYVGHNIINNQYTRVTRPETNTVVLDVMACVSNVALVACHTDSSCQYVGPATVEVNAKNMRLISIMRELSTHLKADAERYKKTNDENMDSSSPVGTPSKRNLSHENRSQSSAMFFAPSEGNIITNKKLKYEDADILNSDESSAESMVFNK